ncbi:MAG: endonuclease III [Acetobacteraceae bacterium]
MTSDQPEPVTRPISAAAVRSLIAALAAANPNPRSELQFTDSFTLLIAVVLSAQTTDKAVNLATRGLFAEAPTPEAMVHLAEAGIARHIRTLGLWQAKARHVAALSRILIERHGGQVPNDRESLEALPGVGRKTANVVLNVAFGQPTMAVDTHVFRVANRSGLAPGRTPREVEDALVRRLPRRLVRDAHHWLILLGRHICKARRPECWRCPAVRYCGYRAKTEAP